MKNFYKIFFYFLLHLPFLTCSDNEKDSTIFHVHEKQDMNMPHTVSKKKVRFNPKVIYKSIPRRKKYQKTKRTSHDYKYLQRIQDEYLAKVSTNRSQLPGWDTLSQAELMYASCQLELALAEVNGEAVNPINLKEVKAYGAEHNQQEHYRRTRLYLKKNNIPFNTKKKS